MADKVFSVCGGESVGKHWADCKGLTLKAVARLIQMNSITFWLIQKVLYL
jgi:hypothetical protein